MEIREDQDVTSFKRDREDSSNIDQNSNKYVSEIITGGETIKSNAEDCAGLGSVHGDVAAIAVIAGDEDILVLAGVQIDTDTATTWRTCGISTRRTGAFTP